MYLGSLISEDGRSEKEIKRRILIARTTFTNTIRLHEDQIKSNTILCLADNILMEQIHGQLSKSLLSRLDAFEMWVYCRV